MIVVAGGIMTDVNDTKGLKKAVAHGFLLALMLISLWVTVGMLVLVLPMALGFAVSLVGHLPLPEHENDYWLLFRRGCVPALLGYGLAILAFGWLFKGIPPAERAWFAGLWADPARKKQ